MKKLQILSVMASIGMIVVLTSCSKDNPTDPGTQVQTDAQAMQYMIENTDTLAQFSASEDFSIDDAGVQESEYSMLAPYGITPLRLNGVVSDSSHPLRWGRHIFWDQIVRDYHVVMSGDTIAVVTVTKTIPGEFWVAWGSRSADSIILDTLVKKPFSEETKRNVLFKRIARHENRLKNWIAVAITMVEGTSRGNDGFTIASLRVSESSHGYDTTVTDPLGTWFRLGPMHGCVPVLPVRDTVTVRVTITSSDDSAEVVYLRHGIGWDGLMRRRAPLELVSTSGGPGNYTRIYQRRFVTELGGALPAARYNAVVDAFSRGSIFDQAAPFSNEFWGVPYIVARF